MAQQAAKLEQLKNEVDERFAEIILNVKNSIEESNQYANTLQEEQKLEINNLEMKMKAEIDSAVFGLKKNMDDQYDELIKIVKALQVSSSAGIPSGAGISPIGGVSLVGADEFVKSSYWIKIVGTTSIAGAWNSIPEIVTIYGKKFKGPKKWMLLEEHVFADTDRKDRDKIIVPNMEASCYWHAGDYLKFIQSMIDYNNHGGRKIPNSWGGASWDRFCTNLDITEPVWKAHITLKQLILVIIYNFWNMDTVTELVGKISGTKLGWFGYDKAITNFRAYKGKLEEYLLYLDYSSENVLQYIEPNINSKDGFFDNLKIIIKTKCASWSSWDQMFHEIQIVSEGYDELYRKGLVPHMVSKKPAVNPKIIADQKVNAAKEQTPNIGFKCMICEKKYVNKKTEELLEGEQNHGYAFAVDGSGPCRCPMGHLKPEKCVKLQAYLREQVAKRQKK